ncbi:MAG: hypothetical protein CMH31_05575 [Micavibrio sp.]|nr:hypothetical protein [Micavibrio sp.]
MMNIEIIPNWHPVLVHFTVALFTVSALLYLAGLVLKKPNLLIVARWNLWIGALATILTIIAGFDAYNSIPHDGPLHVAMTDHKNWALVTAPIFGALALWALFKHRGAKTVSVVFVGLILVASGLLAVTGYKGGEVVYRHGGGVMRLPEISGDGGHGSHSHGEGEEHGDMSVQDSMDMTSMEDNHSNHDHGSQSGHDDIQMTNKKATGQGVINSVDKANRKVNINHEAILDIGWPAMTMDLDVSEDVNLDSLSSNQQIQFHMELGKDKIYRITKIMNANEKIDNDNHDHGGHTH